LRVAGLILVSVLLPLLLLLQPIDRELWRLGAGARPAAGLRGWALQLRWRPAGVSTRTLGFGRDVGRG